MLSRVRAAFCRIDILKIDEGNGKRLDVRREKNNIERDREEEHSGTEQEIIDLCRQTTRAPGDLQFWTVILV